MDRAEPAFALCAAGPGPGVTEPAGQGPEAVAARRPAMATVAMAYERLMRTTFITSISMPATVTVAG